MSSSPKSTTIDIVYQIKNEDSYPMSASDYDPASCCQAPSIIE